jgi:hypothetical protein
VKCVVSFESLRKTWGFDYPKMGEILTVSQIKEHHDKECRDAGIVLLRFYERQNCCDLSDKQINGNHNFIELMPNIDLAVEIDISAQSVDLVQ